MPEISAEEKAIAPLRSCLGLLHEVLQKNPLAQRRWTWKSGLRRWGTDITQTYWMAHIPQQGLSATTHLRSIDVSRTQADGYFAVSVIANPTDGQDNLEVFMRFDERTTWADVWTGRNPPSANASLHNASPEDVAEKLSLLLRTPFDQTVGVEQLQIAMVGKETFEAARSEQRALRNVQLGMA